MYRGTNSIGMMYAMISPMKLILQRTQISGLIAVFALLVGFSACSDNQYVSGEPTLICPGSCDYTPGGANDPVVQLALITESGGNCVAPMTQSAQLFFDDFSDGSGDSAWPANVGYTADFNGDWYSDGSSALLYNPNWGDTAEMVALGTQSGFVKFLDISPASGSEISVSAQVTTTFTDAASKANILLYFFDGSNGLISVDYEVQLSTTSTRSFGLYDVVIPSGTRRIAVVPVTTLANAEMGTSYWDNLTVDYQLGGHYASTAVYSDDFSSYANDVTYGNNQPTGWTEAGGDFFVHAAGGWVNLWNPSWSGNAALLPLSAGMEKIIDVSAFAGNTLNVSMLAAAQFTDSSSFVGLKISFDSATGPGFSTSYITGSSWRYLTISREDIPAGTTSLHLLVDAHLGASETASFYFDDLHISFDSEVGVMGDATLDADGDEVPDLCENCLNVANLDQADGDADGIGDACDPTPAGETIFGTGASSHALADLGLNVVIGANSYIEKFASVGDGTVIGDDVFIGKGAQIGSYVTIGNNVTVDKGTIVGDGSTIGDGTFVSKDSTLGSGVELGQNVIIGIGVVMGNNVVVADGTTIAAGTVIPDDTVLP